jgi:hypothetical protein
LLLYARTLMKNKHIKKHHLSVHQQLERLAHHHLVVSAVLSCMVVGLIKYEMGVVHIWHDIYNEGFGLISTYTHTSHHETLRMPIEHGDDMRAAPISGQ